MTPTAKNDDRKSMYVSGGDPFDDSKRKRNVTAFTAHNIDPVPRLDLTQAVSNIVAPPPPTNLRCTDATLQLGIQDATANISTPREVRVRTLGLERAQRAVLQPLARQA